MKTGLLSTLLLLYFDTSLAFAERNICETYRATEDTVVAREVVDPAVATIEAYQLGMVQASILVENPAQPLTPSEALAAFTDAENQGANGGNLTTYLMPYERSHAFLVRATYFPGENEYGALFEIHVGGGYERADLIGTIRDGDISCLTYEYQQ